MTWVKFENTYMRKRGYDGINVGDSGIYITQTVRKRIGGVVLEGYEVYIDKKRKAIKIVKNQKGRYKMHYNNLNCILGVAMPKGRYLYTSSPSLGSWIFIQK